MSLFGTMSRRHFLTLAGGAAAAVALGGKSAMARSKADGIFDTHVHIAVNDPLRYPVGPEFGNVGNAIFDIAPTAEEFIQLMDANGVTSAALVQHDPVYGEDNAYIADAARKYPERFVAVGRLEAGKADAVETLRYWAKERGLAGFRVNGRGEKDGKSWIETPDTLRIWEAAAELEIPLLLLLAGSDKTSGLAALGRVLKSIPELRVVLDHMGDYNPFGGAPAAVDAQVLDAAGAPNLLVKVSSHNLERFAAAGDDSARRAMKTLVDAFGADRIIWGSDVGNSKTSYPDMIAMARNAFAELSEADRTSILSGTPARLYRRT